MTSKMKYSVKPVFNPASYGLDGPHYAVLADLPMELGGETVLADLVSGDDLHDAGYGPDDLQCAVADAASLMPWGRTDSGGLKVEFQRRTKRGDVEVQNTMYLPLADQGDPAELASKYHHWLSWRVRVGLWLSDCDRQTLSPAQESRLVSMHTQKVPYREESPVFERKLFLA